MLNLFSQNINALLILKIVFLLADSFYILFLFIVLNRIISMSHIVKDAHDAMILRSVAGFKVLVAISLFLFALAIL